MSERELRERMAQQGRSIYERGLTAGSSGNISVRLPDGVLVTPTNSCLGRLDPDEISRLDSVGNLLSGKPPSKESFLHLAYYNARSQEQAVVHLHSTWSVAVSCLADIDPANAIPPITAYFVMRVGKLPLVPYFPPGDEELADAVGRAAKSSRGALLANHGPVIGAIDLDQAVYAIEELEETAKLFLMLRGLPTRYLTDAQVADL
ncbi:3-oxo-tetronate 4-phosphate decarboxylase [Allorhodopirellula heiligendammensis]|uniref:3-oxo-tetronate 4-phosphate decarboxylase n=1 Tax=Allorhodopirellula heiligendammensis TaxID=2714739 RepID=A0A5C6BTR2_9BACT|nr:3-oxo-tetronate 4-phosphate decarboxylase [Allorhodopirellula heiligendammensis]TWU15415.1 L-fuculose phosphate aldolase [Allorhodopirellula heiligendammensis]